MQKVDRETAEREFDRFVEAMDLDGDSSEWDEDDRKGYDLQKGKVISAIMSGSLVVNEDGEPVFNPTVDGDALTFSEPTGAALMAMDRKKKAEDMGKLFAMMAAITGVHPGTFAKMKNRDLKVCMAITTLFMG